MNRIQKNGLKFIVVISIISMFFVFIHLIDLGASALAINEGNNLVAQTLTVQWTPNQIYHIGLIGAAVCFLLIIFFLIYEYFISDKNWCKNE